MSPEQAAGLTESHGTQFLCDKSKSYNTVSDRAFYSTRWADAENWARKSTELKLPMNPNAHANLATALLFQGKYDQALQIYRDHWMDPLYGKNLGNSVLSDFELLEKAGVKHPDIARIRAELPPPKTPANNAAETPK